MSPIWFLSRGISDLDSICLFSKALHLVVISVIAVCKVGAGLHVETALMLVLLGAPRDNSPQ